MSAQRKLAPAPAPLAPVRSLTNGLVCAAIVSAAIALVVLVPLGGLRYYATPLGVRAYERAHPLLRPSGRAGEAFGIAGFLLMLATLAYTARKKWRPLRGKGTTKAWLEVHIFCGLVGPFLITLHASFKFNGVVSIAYWAMALVVASGFVGRYLYVRIPRTIRGTELTRQELESRAAALDAELAAAPLAPELAARLAAVQADVARAKPSALGLLLGDRRLHRRIRAIARHPGAGAAPAQLEDALAVAEERTTLARRLAYLSRTRRLFEMWHVFHKPLVWVTFAIGALHVAVAIYMGYAFR